MPFAGLICRGADILAETANRVSRSDDVTRHAELVAISKTQEILGRKVCPTAKKDTLDAIPARQGLLRRLFTFHNHRPNLFRKVRF